MEDAQWKTGWAGILCLPVLVVPTLLPLNHHDRPQCEGTTLVLEGLPSDARCRDAQRILVRRRGGGRALEKNSAEESGCFMTYMGHSTLDEEGDVVDIVMVYG
jgi:hypothetical protein